jgi:hypothetical protein
MGLVTSSRNKVPQSVGILYAVNFECSVDVFTHPSGHKNGLVGRKDGTGKDPPEIPVRCIC